MTNVIGDSADPKVSAIVGKHTTNGKGLSASSEQGIAIQATAKKDTAVFATSDAGIGVDARSEKNIGVYGKGGKYAGLFDGNVQVNGNLNAGQVSINKNVLLLSGGPKNAYTIALDAEKGTFNMASPDDAHYTIMMDGRNNKIDMGSAHIDGNKGSFGVGQASINKNVLLLWGGPKNAYTIALDGEKGSISSKIQILIHIPFHWMVATTRSIWVAPI
jgi:hypothetical protein